MLQTSGLLCGTSTEMGFKAFCSIHYLQCNNEYMKYSLYRVHIRTVIFILALGIYALHSPPGILAEPACKLGTETLKASFLFKAVHKADVVSSTEQQIGLNG